MCADRNTKIRASQVLNRSLTKDDFDATGATDGFVLTVQADGSVDWEAASGGGGGTVNRFEQSFTNANLSSGILTVTHNLNQKYVSVSVYDNNDKKIIPNEVTLTNTTTLSIDLSSFGTIVGTWRVLVLG